VQLIGSRKNHAEYKQGFLESKMHPTLTIQQNETPSHESTPSPIDFHYVSSPSTTLHLHLSAYCRQVSIRGELVGSCLRGNRDRAFLVCGRRTLIIVRVGLVTLVLLAVLFLVLIASL
jgi:hypothetical protein